MRLALVIVVSCTLAGSARAGGELDPDTEIARRHFEAGRERYEASDYQAALKEFEAARKVRPLAAFDYNIGRCLDRMERAAEAIQAYQRYLDSGGDLPDAVEVRERIRILQARIAPEIAPPPTIAASQPKPNKLRWVAPSVIGAAALALAAGGAGLLGSVQSDFDRMATGPDSCRPCAAMQIDPLRTRAYTGDALLGVAGALAIVDVALWIWTARRRR